MALHRGDGDGSSVAGHRGTSQKVWKVLDPVAKGTGRDAFRVVLWIVQDTEDVVGQELGDREGHARETLHEELDGLLAVELERRAHALRSVRPGVIMVQP